MKDDKLRGAGLKVTLPRKKILQMLEDASSDHMSAEEIYRSLKELYPEIGLATVYRVLAQFEQAGLVMRHNFEGGHSVFELDTGEHHDHLVCIECGRIEEFVDEQIEARQEVISRERAFKMTDHNLTIYGVCDSCHNRPDA